jgi:hypothetical protein
MLGISTNCIYLYALHLFIYLFIYFNGANIALGTLMLPFQPSSLALYKLVCHQVFHIRFCFSSRLLKPIYNS